jgi:hypothetical protein
MTVETGKAGRATEKPPKLRGSERIGVGGALGIFGLCWRGV